MNELNGIYAFFDPVIILELVLMVTAWYMC